MPETWVSLSRMFAPHEIAERTPQSRKGHLTFGTANNPYKYTPACLDAWAAVLRTVLGSRFVFLRPEGGVESFRANARAAFARRDVDPDRLDFIGVRGDHMRHYNEIDIALDTLPHVGGTTTCEALWMGVPTVSLIGPGFAERLSSFEPVECGAWRSGRALGRRLCRQGGGTGCRSGAPCGAAGRCAGADRGQSA
ncbi:O-linked N-acetylglucosamine transferase family protein (plasmid) [Rhodobacter capsulatus]|uniref:O-linked N-acetylglucosamine transferase family protein n=1 Tax=Rhodobacter capsulatus TaxID=1061 RepID=UPI00402A283F